MKIEKLYSRTRKKRTKIVFWLFLLLLTSILTALLVGAVPISLLDFVRGNNINLLSLRAARIILGIVAGAALAVAGVIFQAILRNPLAEPYVLGVSSGAGLGAVIAIIFGLGKTVLGMSLTPLTAFLGAIFTMILVYTVARRDGKVPVQSLLLSGIIVAAIFSSILMFLISVCENTKLHGIIWWLLGNLQIFDIQLLTVVCIIVVAGIGVVIFFSRELNAIALGEETAQHLGIETETIKKVLIVIASLITAASVSACGLIGFVGLIVPHASRMLVGPDHRILLPVSALSGGIFLIVCDAFARTIIRPVEIPIGVITALIGGPFFIILLRRKQRIT